MTTPQPGVFDEGPNLHGYLEVVLDDAATPDAIRAALRHAVAVDTAQEPVVIGFGRRAWERVGKSRAPSELRDFEPIGSGTRVAPATQHDLWIWIQGNAVERVVDASVRIGRAISGVGRVELDQLGFRRAEKRGFEGFIDGTENPVGEQARLAALIPDGEDGAGGSYVLTQRWVHDLDKFEALSVTEQENVIGRTRAESIELAPDRMPATSHVSRTDAEVDGVAQKIYRRSLPYANATTQGLYFLAFACALGRIDIQLRRMYGVSGDGLHDAVTDFSTAVTGSYWFVPSQEDLRAAIE